MTAKLWFEEWFDSPYYHLLYSNRSDAEAELFIKKIAAHLNLQPGQKALDVACGKGRHAKTLSQLGLDVTGIDLSANSICEAKKHECSNLHFDVWDMRKVFKKESFDSVFNLFSSFGYFTDDAEDYNTIHAFYENLKPGGLLVFDYINTEWAVKQLKPREIIQRNETQFHIQKKLEEGFIKKQIDFVADGQLHSYEEKLKVINAHKFHVMLQHSGFSLKYTFGDYSLLPFQPAHSPRLIIIAEKK